MEYLLTVLGFAILVGSGKYLVMGSVSLASYLKISKLVIGVTVVAFGTSAPELLVSVQAALKGHSEIAIGNVIGSNIANIGLVLAITAIILPIPVSRYSIRIDWPVMMGVSLLLLLFARDFELSRIEGIVLILILLIFVVLSVRSSRKKQQLIDEDLHPKPEKSIFVSLVLILLSCVGLFFGADLLVDNVSIIAADLGVSERAIAVTVIAVGTSLPELVTSIMAAIQKESDISIGNIIGSNIFNILSVLGITALIKPIGISEEFIRVDILWMLGISFLMFVLLRPWKKAFLSRIDGLILLSAYFAYVYVVFN